MIKRKPKIHVNVRLPAPVHEFITRRSRQRKQDFTAALTDILTSAIAAEELRP